MVKLRPGKKPLVMLYNLGIDIESIKRYSRQIILNQIGVEGQKKLQKSKVLVVGLGGLGSPVLMYLAASGIGTIGIADFDSVEIHNLQRQVVHSEKDIGRLKTQSAYEFVKNLNGSIRINIHETDSCLSSGDFIQEYDIVLDCADNMEVRYNISDLCKVYDKPLVLASVLRFEGQVYTLPQSGPCYRCLFPEYRENVQTCDTAGVLGSVCGIIGSIQATETIKYILSERKPKLIVFDAWVNQIKNFDISGKKRKDCCVCQSKQIPKKKLMANASSLGEPLPCKFRLEWSDYFNNQKDFLLVDIRPSSNFLMYNVKDSINYPVDSIKANPQIDFGTRKKIALVCKRGVTAKRMAALLHSQNREAYYITGGLEKFKADYEPEFPL